MITARDSLICIHFLFVYSKAQKPESRGRPPAGTIDQLLFRSSLGVRVAPYGLWAFQYLGLSAPHRGLPVIMFDRWLTVLSVLSAVALASRATPPAPLWSDVRVKHTWNTVPANWESLGPPPAYTTIDLFVALKPDRKNALTNALYEVSNPRHQKHVVLTTHPPVLALTYAAAPFQIYRILVQEAGC